MRIGDPDLSQYGADWFTEGAINLFNGGNPIIKSNVDDLANRDAAQLLALASAIESSDDPAFIAQALVAGSVQHQIFHQALEPYAGRSVFAEHGRRAYARVSPGQCPGLT